MPVSVTLGGDGLLHTHNDDDEEAGVLRGGQV